MDTLIRVAVRDDAAGAAKVMCRSIVGVCASDHKNDKALIGRWFANRPRTKCRSGYKTAETRPRLRAGAMSGSGLQCSTNGAR